MSEIYEKIGSGINKIQGNLQTTQVIAQHKKVIQDSSQKRIEILVQLGEEVYKKLRNKEIESEELTRKVGPLLELDRRIYQSQQTINAQSTSNLVCPSCGASLTEDDKFCGSCGSKIEHITKEEVTETKICSSCEEKIPVQAAFCNCCGTKLS